MKRRNWGFNALFTVMVLLALTLVGCQKESHVKITLLGSQRSGQEVSNRQLTLVEGQVLHLRVSAVKKRTIKDKWKVSARSNNRSLVTVSEVKGADHTNEFIVAGRSAGTTELEFTFRQRRVVVDVDVTGRDDWEPLATPYSFGGAGGFGGSLSD